MIIKKDFKLLLILAIMFSLFLTACENNQNLPAETSGKETSVSTNANTLSSDIETTYTSLSPDEQLQAAINSFPIDTFITPDGNEHSFSEAVSGIYDESINTKLLTFGIGYLGYANSFFYDSYSDPELFLENFEFNKYEDKIYDEIKKGMPKFFEVKSGQELENGLTVSSTEFSLTPIDRPNEKGAEITSIEVKTKGSLELSGVLFHISQDPQYLTALGDVMFYPDTLNNSNIPYPYCKAPDDLMPLYSGIDVKNEFSFVTSGVPYYLGNINDMDIDVSEFFADKDYVKVNVTLTDPYMTYFQGNGKCGATLTKIEAAE